MSKVIMFPGMQKEAVEIGVEKKNYSGVKKTAKSTRSKQFKTPMRVKSNKIKKNKRKRGALSTFIRNIILAGMIIKRALKVKAVRKVVFSASAICIVGAFVLPKVINVGVADNVTVKAAPAGEEAMSYVESFNSEMDEKFKESIGETIPSSNKEITEDIVIKLTPKIKGEAVPSYLVAIKATLPHKKISKNEDGSFEYNMKDVGYVLMSIEPNLSEKELGMMDEKSIDAMYKEMESLRKKAIKELSQSEEVLSNVSEAINEVLYN